MSICGLDFENTILNGKDGYIKSATAKVENQNIALTLGVFVKTIGNCGGRRLVDNSFNIELSDSSSILSSLSLRVIEVSRYGDNSIFDSLAEISFSNIFHFG